MEPQLRSLDFPKAMSSPPPPVSCLNQETAVIESIMRFVPHVRFLENSLAAADAHVFQ
jgi:hypothetical protein